MLLKWKQVGVLTCCGYILGFPGDTEESILHDVRIIQKELPIDLLEFFILTPLPGSEDHQKLYNAGVAMDPDMNKYDVNHVTTAHPRMSAAEWEHAFQSAWRTYYSFEHVDKVLRRAMATGVSPGKALFYMVWFKGCMEVEKIHPLEGGILRLKFRRDRRAGMPLESPLTFYPKYWLGTAAKAVKWAALYTRMYLIYQKIKRDPARMAYTDLALTPVADDDVNTRELFQSDEAQAYVAIQQRFVRIQQSTPANVP